MNQIPCTCSPTVPQVQAGNHFPNCPGAPVKQVCDNNCEAKGWMPGHAPECALGGPTERAGTVGRSLTLRTAR